ncbi:MAG: glycosyltransferase [Solirubrobacterales bacterium]
MAEGASAIGGSPGAQGLALAGADSPRSAIHTTAVGISATATCGVRDYAKLLARALGEENVCCSLLWLERGDEPLLAARSQVRSWARELAGKLAEDPPRAVLLHYSVFSYSYRGLPVFVPPVLAVLGRARIPLLTILHEFVYPWGHTGVRGTAWAVSQRALLIDVMRTSTAVLVTTESRAEWLASRPWLAKRPVGVAPVFSNLPPATVGLPGGGLGPAIGLFGYSYPAPMIALVLDALSRVRKQGVPVQLRLLGSPGQPSTIADAWLAAARMRAVSDALLFSGTLSSQGLSDALAGCDILLFADPPGPTSRKTTLAASLASGRPVLALDGPQRWTELAQAEAAMIVSPTADALADAITALLDDERAREALGARGHSFAQQRMGLRPSARVVAGIVEEMIS